MATNYDINYDDERFTQVESNKQEALSELEQTYAGMIGESDKYYQAQIDASSSGPIHSQSFSKTIPTLLLSR